MEKNSEIIEYIKKCVNKGQSLHEIAKTIESWEDDEEVEAYAMAYISKLYKINFVEANF